MFFLFEIKSKLSLFNTNNQIFMTFYNLLYKESFLLYIFKNTKVYIILKLSLINWINDKIKIKATKLHIIIDIEKILQKINKLLKSEWKKKVIKILFRTL